MPSTAFDPAANQPPLSDADLDALGEILGADWAPATTMDIEQLDGFLAGLICAPHVVLPSTYVTAIFGDEEVTWPDMETAQRFHGLLMRRWNEIATALNEPIERLDDPRAYVPLLIDWDEAGADMQELVAAGEMDRAPLYGELWARGFLQAVNLTRDDWDDVPEGDEEGAQLINEALTDILALVPEDDDEAVRTGAASAQSPQERDELVGNALIAAYDLRDYWRDVSFERARVKEPIRREPKTGRNMPCPCGSGKKFKNCHGRGD